MNRTFLWSTGSLVLAAASFFAARPAFSPPEALSGAESRTQPVRSGSRSSAELGAEVAALSKTGDPLTAKASFLSLVENASVTELSRLYLSPQTSRREKRSIAQRWAELDPKSLFTFLKGMSRTEWERDSDQNDAVRGILFRAWAVQDPDAALAAAQSLRLRPQFQGAQWEIVNALFETDPARGFAAAASLGPYTKGDRLVDSVWKDNPAKFLEAAGSASMAALKNYTIFETVSSAFSELAGKNPAAAAAWLASRPVEQQRKMWSSFARQLAEKDLTAAQEFIKNVPPSPEREAAGASVVAAWAKKDPRAALDWLQDNLQGGRAQAFAGVAEALARQGIDSAKQLLDAMPAGSARDAVVEVVARRWAEKDMKSAAAWITSLPEGDPGRRRAMQQMGYQWPEKDLEGAAAFVRANPDSEDAREIFWSVNRRYCEKGLNAAVEWAESLPGKSRPQVFGNLFAQAFSEDGKKLTDLFGQVEKLPQAQRDMVLHSGVSTLLRSSFGTNDGSRLGAIGLKHVPASLRDEVRTIVNSDQNLDPTRRDAAMKALDGQ